MITVDVSVEELKMIISRRAAAITAVASSDDITPIKQMMSDLYDLLAKVPA